MPTKNPSLKCHICGTPTPLYRTTCSSKCLSIDRSRRRKAAITANPEEYMSRFSTLLSTARARTAAYAPEVMFGDPRNHSAITRQIGQLYAAPCPTCGYDSPTITYRLKRRKDLKGAVIRVYLRCTNSSCRYLAALFSGTPFFMSHISLVYWMEIVRRLARGETTRDIAGHVGISYDRVRVMVNKLAVVGMVRGATAHPLAQVALDPNIAIMKLRGSLKRSTN